ncbi:GumC family protein [Cohaesibacter gelatinilyticus]|uniref:Uncharacterized protein involved in exopolysaccharide biosynthesis n=1 Tax=Cohaesibacter gelatinilyticus TaxID=372072 RepID=A0A285PLB7_9HYPH|nr:GumC family protein [Cohaesibacter gelatinilyticus]SNZ20661.1 Uncharacterized protein involved in exopolysaccharide biosynthesis [Cohaesibacter gelatinilyticus]
MRNRGHGQCGLDWQPEQAEHEAAALQQGEPSDTWTGLIHPRAMLAFFTRRFTTILLVASLVFGLGLAVYMVLPGKYSSQALVLVDPRQPRVTLTEDVLPGIGGDAAALTSLVQIMKSDGFLAKAVNALDLSSDPDYASAASEKALIDSFRKNMSASRQGATYIVEVNVSSKDPQKAARYANGLAELFINEINDNRLDASTEAAEWLSQRLTLLRTNLKKSEDAVASYQAKAGIVDTGNQSTLDNQQLTSLVTQLSNATTEVEDTKARFDQAKRDGVPASSSSGQGDQFLNLNQLLQEQSRLRRQAAELNQTLGARHPRIMANKEQQRIIAGQVQSEKRRLVQQAGQAYKAAKAKRASVQRQLADARSRAIRQNKQSVELVNLQREAKANRDLYEQFLARYKVTDEQSRLQSDEAKIASAATVPLKSNKPSIKLVIPILAVLGGILGLITALILEAFSTPSSARAASMTAAASGRRRSAQATKKRARHSSIPEKEMEGEEEWPHEGEQDQEMTMARWAEQREQRHPLVNKSLSPRRRAAIERQIAEKNAQKKQRMRTVNQRYADHEFHVGSDQFIETTDEFDGMDSVYSLGEQPEHSSYQPRVYQRMQDEPNHPSLRNLGRSQRRNIGPQSHMRSVSDAEFGALNSHHEAYGENVHSLYPSGPYESDDGILFGIPQDIYGKLRSHGRMEDSTIRNLADNVLRRNIELSALLKDNFNHIDSFLRSSESQAFRSVLLASFSSERAQDLVADVLRDYAIQSGQRPVLVTLSEAPDRKQQGIAGVQEDDPWSGLQEYDDHDVIHFTVGPVHSFAHEDMHWSIHALESEQFAHLMQICEQRYGLVIVVAPTDLPQEEVDDMVDLFDAVIAVLDQTLLDHQDLSEWQDWAMDADGALVLDRV